MVYFRDAEDAAADLNGKKFNGDRVRVELAYTPREKERAREREGGDRRDRGGFGGRDRRRSRSPFRGGAPGGRTPYRVIVDNLSSRTSWQVRVSLDSALILIFLRIFVCNFFFFGGGGGLALSENISCVKNLRLSQILEFFKLIAVEKISYNSTTLILTFKGHQL